MFTAQKKLLSACEAKRLKPLTSDLAEKKQAFDNLLRENFNTRNKFVTVCGPCSADEESPMTEYFTELKKMSEKCRNLLIVARVYTSKPHSNGQGYRGACFGNCDDCDISDGILLCRQIMLNCIGIGLPVADELLYPELYPYFDDLVSYWFLGARSSEDTIHRSILSGVDVCCGVKNSTDGNIERAVDSLYAVTHPCVFPWGDRQIVTDGAKYSHIVLRGGNLDNKFFSNITLQSTEKTKSLLRKAGLNDFIMADLSHANSAKIAKNQIVNAENIINDTNIDGVMVESYLFEGGNSEQRGVSKTDECIGIEDTRSLLDFLSNRFSKKYTKVH